MLFPIRNIAVIAAAIRVSDLAVDEVAIMELAFVGTGFVFPDAWPLRFVILYAALVSVAIFVLEFTLAGHSILESALKKTSLSIFHGALPMRLAVVVALTFVEGFVGTWDSIGLISTHSN